MKLALWGPSALQFWRARTISPQRMGHLQPLPQGFIPSFSQEEARYMVERFGLISPVFTLAGSLGARRDSRCMASRFSAAALSDDCLVHIGKQLYVTSPEYALLQVASYLTSVGSIGCPNKFAGEIILATLAMELAGNYRLHPGSEDGFRKAAQITSPEAIGDLLNAHSRVCGIKLLESALPYVVVNANSPAEVQLALFMSLPKPWGGMGVALPELNSPVVTKVMGVPKTRYGDLCWLDAKRIVEYNGGYHQGERANDDDKRRNALISAGYVVNVVNSEQLHDAEALEDMLAEAARRVGSFGRKPKDYVTRREAMRSLVFETCDTRCAENRGCLIPGSLHPAPYDARSGRGA